MQNWHITDLMNLTTCIPNEIRHNAEFQEGLMVGLLELQGISKAAVRVAYRKESAGLVEPAGPDEPGFFALYIVEHGIESWVMDFQDENIAYTVKHVLENS